MNKAKAEKLEEIARQRFIELIGDSPVPVAEAERISIGRIPHANGVTIKVSLLPEGELSDDGHLVDDLSGIIELCRLDVDGSTEEVTVTLLSAISWLNDDKKATPNPSR